MTCTRERRGTRCPPTSTLLQTQPTGACCKVGQPSAPALGDHCTLDPTCASAGREDLLQRVTQAFQKFQRNSLAGTAVHKHCDSKRKNNPFTHLCRGMWEGFKVKQIVLANTGMENASPPPEQSIPKLAASAAGSVHASLSLFPLAEQIQTMLGAAFITLKP